jgi:hypothetical protein
MIFSELADRPFCMKAADKTNWDMATLGNNREKHQNY